MFAERKGDKVLPFVLLFVGTLKMCDVVAVQQKPQKRLSLLERLSSEHRHLSYHLDLR